MLSTVQRGIDQWAKSLMKVNTRLLVKAFSNKQSFIPSKKTAWIAFDAKHLFVAHNILPRAQGNKRLGTVPNESIIFFLHCQNPLGILKSSGYSVRFNERGSELVSGLGLGMEFLELVCMGWWLSGGKGSRV